MSKDTQDRIFIHPIVADAVHIDTVKLGHGYRATDLPPSLELKKLNFDLTLKTRGNNEITTAYSRAFNNESNEPRITIIRSENLLSYSGLNVECSLAKLVNGTGLGIQTDEDISCALDAIEDFIRQKVGVNFDARTAIVTRLDVNADFRVGEELIDLYLKAISQPYSRLTPSTFGDTTRYFYNKSRTFAIYAKKKEMEKLFKQKKVSQEDVIAADGLLRIEDRLKNGGAVKRFAKTNSLSANGNELLTKAVALKFIAETISKLKLDRPRFSMEAKNHLLLQHFKGGAPEMLGILIYRELYGEEFWKKLGWSQSTYYRKRKVLELVNLWDTSPAEAIPALAILDA